MNKSSKLKMTLRILLALVVVFTIGNIAALQYSKKKILNEADVVATRDMDNLLLHADKLLTECQTSGYNLRGLLSYETIGSDKLNSVLETFLNVNPHLYGVVAAFEPSQFKRFGIKTPAIFMYGHKDQGYKSVRLDSIYDYTQSEWFLKTKNLNHSNWGHPIKASDGTLLAPFCMPMRTPEGEFLGVLSVDIQLAELSEALYKAAPFSGAIVTMMDEQFRFVAHPNKDYVLKMSLDSLLRASTVQVNESIFVEMKEAKRGSSSYGKGDEARLIYYAPVEKTNWTITIDCKYSDIYAPVEDMKKGMLINMLFGMLIFLFVCWKLFKRVEQYEQTAAAKAAIQGELNIAAAIQKGMLPKLYPPFPEVAELDVFGTLIPAKEVGGDLFDYFIRDGKFFFCIGDVSGKGVPASLFMAVLRSLFRNVSLHATSPAEIATSLNKALSEGNEQNMFCTMFLGVLDYKTGHLRFCNCGHNKPVVRHITPDNQIDVHYEDIETNIAVGIFEDFPYQEQEVNMKPGEAIFLYTDGVTEAESADKELYGEDRLLKALSDARSHNVRTAKDFVEAIYNDVESFAEIGYQSDDITMVVVEYKGPQVSRVGTR